MPDSADSLVYPVYRDKMVACYIRLNRTLAESSKSSEDLSVIIADFVDRTQVLRIGVDSESYRLTQANSLIKFTGNKKRDDLRLYGVELATSECGNKLYELCYAASHKELGAALDAKVQKHHQIHYETLPMVGKPVPISGYRVGKR